MRRTGWDRGRALAVLLAACPPGCSNAPPRRYVPRLEPPFNSTLGADKSVQPRGQVIPSPSLGVDLVRASSAPKPDANVLEAGATDPADK